MAPDFDACCMIRARELIAEVKDTPWSVCAINSTSPSTVHPQVPASMAWCIQNCGSGYQLAVINEWVHPLVNWIVPYIGLLVLCPVGQEVKQEVKDEDKEKDEDSPRIIEWLQKALRPWRRAHPTATEYLHNTQSLFYFVREYFNILGDPASAIWGALSELQSDTQLAMSLAKQDGPFQKDLVRLVILARQTKFNKAKWGTLMNGLIFKRLLVLIESELLDATAPIPQYDGLTSLRNFLARHNREQRMHKLFPDSEDIPDFVKRASVPNINLNICLRELRDDLRRSFEGFSNANATVESGFSVYQRVGIAVETEDAPRDLLRELLKVLPEEGDYSGSYPTTPQVSPPDASDLVIRQFETGMSTILRARIALVNGIVLPTVLALAVTASVFFDAYNQLGDNQTAHSLAFGVLYSWLLIVVVVGNCYATCVNPGLVKSTIGDLIEVSNKTLPFRKRYANAALWQAWLNDQIAADAGEEEMTSWRHPLLQRRRKIEIFGPKFYSRFLLGQGIGWVCMAVATASAAAISYTTPPLGIGCRSFNHALYGIMAFVLAMLRVFQHWVQVNCKQGWKRDIVDCLYVSLVYINALILTIGTSLNLAGVYRSCRCQLLFTSTDVTVQLGKMTNADIDEAKEYWIPVGYVAFTFVWLVCTIAIALRSYINAYIEDVGVRKGEAD